MKTKQYRIFAILKTVSPLHIASPGAARLVLDTMEVRNTSNKSEGIPCTRIEQLMLPTLGGGKEVDGEVVGRRQARVPVIPSNNINGHLRRHAAEAMFEMLAANNQVISIETFSGIMCGAVTGNPDGNTILFDEYREARAHPFVGLFGGGPRMMRRYVRVHSAVPITAETKDTCFSQRLRHPRIDWSMGDVRMVANGARLIQPRAFRRLDDLRALSNVDVAATVINEFDDQIRARQEKIISDQSSEKTEGDTSKFSTLTYSAIEYVVPGVHFPLAFELDVNDTQMGLFLTALHRFATTDRLGGIVRNGFGVFELNDIYLLDANDASVCEKIDVDGGIDFTLPLTTRFRQAWESEASKLTGARLDYLMRLPKEKDKKKKAAAATGEA